MAGIRLSHETVRNARMALTHPTQKLKARFDHYGKPVGCYACGGLVHERKTYHLDFDGEGTCIVSKEIFDELSKYGLEHFGLKLENEVEAPPTQVVRLQGDPIAFAVPADVPEIKRPRLHVFKRRMRGL